jgi:hypothetical protein
MVIDRWYQVHESQDRKPSRSALEGMNRLYDWISIDWPQHGSTLLLSNNWLPLFYDLNIRVTLTGHEPPEVTRKKNIYGLDMLTQQ